MYFKAIQRIAGKSADGFRDDHIDLASHALLYHAVELITLFRIGTANSIISKNPSKHPLRVILNVGSVMCTILDIYKTGLKTVQ
jgi:hypothetical protein